MAIKSRNLAKDSWKFRVPVGQTTASSKIAEFQNAAGTTKASIDIEGDVVCNEVTIGAGTAIKKVFVATTASTDIAAIDAGAVSSTEFVVAGVAVGDAAVLLTPPLVGTAASVLTHTVECIAGKIRLNLANPSAGALDPAAKAYSFLVFDLT